MSAPAHLDDRLLAEVARRREEIVALTQDLIRFPTLNPPGGGYRAICDFLAARLTRAGFACEMLRAEGTPGDSERYPRWNLVARRQGARPGPCVHFNGHTDVVEVGHGWTVDPFGAERREGRIYG
ncbi:MAG: succinyl-diaminopimelate desuccinylase, partial [Alphaproteobacteria bacterium HGW-Alphaproteobacteria-2]